MKWLVPPKVSYAYAYREMVHDRNAAPLDQSDHPDQSVSQHNLFVVVLVGGEGGPGASLLVVALVRQPLQPPQHHVCQPAPRRVGVAPRLDAECAYRQGMG